MPRRGCGRCKSEKVSNVTIEVQGQSYKLCDNCFSDYLKVDAADNNKQIEFIRGRPPDSNLGKLWYWIKRTARAIM